MTKVHFFVLQHGLNGETSDCQFIEQHLLSKRSTDDDLDIRTLRVSSTEGRTHEGIEVLGQLSAREIAQYFEANQFEQYDVIYFSMIGHSLGGLINRNSIAWLFGDKNSTLYSEDQNSTGTYIHNTFSVYKPLCKLISYITLTTPHLGSRRPGGSIGKNFWRVAAHAFLNTSVGRTGKELALADQLKYGESSSCLLEIMSEPDSVYMKVLAQFMYRTAIGTVHFDLTVPFSSASIRSFNPYPEPPYVSSPEFLIAGYSGFDDHFYQDHILHPLMPSISSQERGVKEISDDTGVSTEIIHEDQSLHSKMPLETKVLLSMGDLRGTEHQPDSGEENGKGYYCDNARHVEYKREILHNLQTLKWRRVDVEYRLQNFRQKHPVHVLPIQKERKFNFGGSLAQVSPLCGQMTVQLVLLDHQRSMSDHS